MTLEEEKQKVNMVLETCAKEILSFLGQNIDLSEIILAIKWMSDGQEYGLMHEGKAFSAKRYGAMVESQSIQ